MNDFISSSFLAALIALKPMSYFIRLTLPGVAFGAAMNPDKVTARIIGFVWLIVTGIGLLIVGIGSGTAIDIILGLLACGAAAYSWWHTRY